MRRVLPLLLLLCIFAVPSFAYEKAQGWCENGGTAVTIPGTQGSGTQRFQQTYRSCTVTVYAAGTTTLSTIYADNAGTAQANPFTASATGQWSFFALEGSYDVRFSAGGIPSPFTLGAVNIGSTTTNCNLFSGATLGAKINTAVAALPAAGGVIDCRSQSGAQTISAAVVLSKPIQLLLGATTITCTVKPCISFGNDVFIRGIGPTATKITGTGSGGVVAPSDPSSRVYRFDIEHIALSNTSSATAGGIALDFNNVTHSRVYDVRLESAATCLRITDPGGVNDGAWLNEFRSFSMPSCGTAISISGDSHENKFWGGHIDTPTTGCVDIVTSGDVQFWGTSCENYNAGFGYRVGNSGGAAQFNGFHDVRCEFGALGTCFSIGANAEDTTIFRPFIANFAGGTFITDNGTRTQVYDTTIYTGKFGTGGGSGNIIVPNTKGLYAFSTAGTAFIVAVLGSTNEIQIGDAGTNVGVGIANPTFPLDVSSTTAIIRALSSTGTNEAYLRPENTGGAALIGKESSAGGQLLTGDIAYSLIVSSGGTNRAMQFGTNDTVRMTIAGATTAVGIGTSTPSTTLDTVGGSLRNQDANSNSAIVLTADDSSGGAVISSTGTTAGITLWPGNTSVYSSLSTSGAWRWHAYGAGTLTTDASGNITAVSDERLKNIVGPFTAGLREILKLKTITYKWKPQSGMETEYFYAGLGARNVKEVIPLASGHDANGNLTIQDRAIIAALVNSTKELKAELDKLKKKIPQVR